MTVEKTTQYSTAQKGDSSEWVDIPDKKPRKKKAAQPQQVWRDVHIHRYAPGFEYECVEEQPAPRRKKKPAQSETTYNAATDMFYRQASDKEVEQAKKLMQQLVDGISGLVSPSSRR